MNKKNIVIIFGAGANLGELEYFGKYNNECTTLNFFSDKSKCEIEKTHPHLYTLVDICKKTGNSSLTFVEIIGNLIAKMRLFKYYAEINNQIYAQYELNSFHRIFRDNKTDPKIQKHFFDIFEEYQKKRKPFGYSKAYKYFPKNYDYNDCETMIGFELQDLRIERFSIDYDDNSVKDKIKYSPHYFLTEKIIELVKNGNDVNIINLNYDVNFENMYSKYYIKNTDKIENDHALLQMIFNCIPLIQKKNNFDFADYFADYKDAIDYIKIDDKKYFDFFRANKNKYIPIIKPHGGFNIFHDPSKKRLLFKGINKAFTLSNYRNNFEDLLEPSVIGYLGEPDEFWQEHNQRFSNVGKYFKNQKRIYNYLLQDATHLLVIGYSFPTADYHLYKEKDENNVKIEENMKTKLGNIKERVIICNQNIPDIVNKIFPKNNIINNGYSKDNVNKAMNKLLER